MLLAGQVGDIVHHLVLRDSVVDTLAVAGRQQLLDAGRLFEHLELVPAHSAGLLEEAGPAVLGDVHIYVTLQVTSYAHSLWVPPLLIQELAESLRGVDAARGRALVRVTGRPEPIKALLRGALEPNLRIVREVRVIVQVRLDARQREICFPWFSSRALS